MTLQTLARDGQLRRSGTAPVAKSENGVVSLKKLDEEQQVVFGEVYAPGFPDSQGDFMTAESIREMAYAFMQKGELSNIDTQHSRDPNGSYVVESFIAREDDPIFIPGSWVLGVKVPDPDVWALVKSGELNGFSLDGQGFRVPTTLEFEVPDLLKGETTDTDGHTHEFYVQFGPAGEFLGGQTSVAKDGHFHPIRRGTATEEVSGHSHRFSFVEGIISAQNDG